MPNTKTDLTAEDLKALMAQADTEQLAQPRELTAADPPSNIRDAELAKVERLASSPDDDCLHAVPAKPGQAGDAVASATGAGHGDEPPSADGTLANRSQGGSESTANDDYDTGEAGGNGLDGEPRNAVPAETSETAPAEQGPAANGWLRNNSGMAVVRVFEEEIQSLICQMGLEGFLSVELADVELPEGFRVDAKGVHCDPEGKGNYSIQIARRPLWVHAESASENGDERRVIVRGVDSDGRIRDVAVAMDILYGRNGLAARLAENGLRSGVRNPIRLAEYLEASTPRRRLLRVDRTGWVGDGKGMAFVLPERAIVGPNGPVGIDPADLRTRKNVESISALGSLEEWQRDVAIRVQGNPILMFGIMVGMAAPLLQPLALEGGGFHLYGPSSKGKTTAAQACASVWGLGASSGNPAAPSYLSKWSATGNAVEPLANGRSGLCLVLDELGEFAGNDLDRIVYKLSSGEGKARMTRSAGLRDPYRWHLLVVSTGEWSVREGIDTGTSRRSRAGQEVRMVDIPTGDDVLVECHDKAPADFADEIKGACSTCYGTAGPAFVRALLDMPDMYGDARRLQGECLGRLLEDAKANDAEKRVVKRFALVACAGTLACRAGVLPYSEQEALDAVTKVMGLWLRATVLLSDSMKGVTALRDHLNANVQRMQNADSPGQNPAYTGTVQIKTVGNRTVALLDNSTFTKACGGYSPTAVARELLSLGLLHCTKGGKLQARFRLGDLAPQGVQRQAAGKLTRVYAVDLSILDLDFETRQQTAAEPDEEHNDQACDY
jgi:uncharacterized protein (DUF927 family)